VLLNRPKIRKEQGTTKILAMSTPNFVDPESRKTLILAIEVTFTGLAVVFVCARFYARTVVKNVLGGDDWCMLAAMVRTFRFLCIDLILTTTRCLQSL
jgi:hypothetical protein